MTELARREDYAPVHNLPIPQPTYTVEPGQALVSWAQALSSAHQIAQALCQTSFVPRHFSGKPDEAAAALMLGDELGLSPVSALRSIFVIGGTPGMYAKAMVGLVQSRGHEVWTEKDTPERVVVCGRRAGSTQVEKADWTIDRARRAGYTNNKKYETDPQAMLYARAAADVCRRIGADILAGVPYSVEEMELETAPAAKKVRRQTPVPETPEPDFAAAQETVIAPEDPAEPDVDSGEPEPITKAQLTKLHACLTDIGITDRDTGLSVIADYAGLESLDSSKSLTKSQASRVIDLLDNEAKAATA